MSECSGDVTCKVEVFIVTVHVPVSLIIIMSVWFPSSALRLADTFNHSDLFDICRVLVTPPEAMWRLVLCSRAINVGVRRGKCRIRTGNPLLLIPTIRPRLPLLIVD